jgi:lipoyl synthase
VTLPQQAEGSRRSAAGLSQRLPEWARKSGLLSARTHGVLRALRAEALSTVCEEARCPNLGECFSRGTAAFLILGDRCTRRCGYCSVETGKPAPVDTEEPRRVAEAAARLGIGYVVVTSVTRDDLADGGAAHYAAVVEALRRRVPGVKVELLTPDFGGDVASAAVVLAAAPDVFNHNLETVPRLFPPLRPSGSYRRSLGLLRAVKLRRPEQVTKSGLMVGLGETDREVGEALGDLHEAGVDIVTIGQYLRPRQANVPVARYVPPEVFAGFERQALALGIPTVHSGVFVRSSFGAEEVARRHSGAGPSGEAPSRG